MSAPAKIKIDPQFIVYDHSSSFRVIIDCKSMRGDSSDAPPYLSLADEPEFDPSDTDSDPKMTRSKNTCLVIEKSKSCNINSREPLQNDKSQNAYRTFGILGVINICGFNYLAVVSERNLAARLSDGSNVYEVAGVQFLPFSTPTVDEALKIDELKQGLEKLLVNTGFYFSYHVDLSAS